MLLALGSFGLVSRGVAQDRVYLQSLTDTSTTKDRSQDGPATNGNTFTRDTLNKVSYTRGVGLTNEYRSFQVNSTTPATPPPGEESWWTGGYFSLSAVTNVMVNPWVTASQWLGEGAFTDTQCSSNFSYQGGTIYTNDTSNTVVSACGSYFNEQTPYKGAAYATEYVYSNYWGTTVVGTNTNNTTTEITSVVYLDTDTNGTGSALYKLTAGFDLPFGSPYSPYSYDPFFLAFNGPPAFYYAGKYQIASNDTDTLGVTWKVFGDGTTNNDISVTIKADYTNEIQDFVFTPSAQRVTLGLEWKSNNTNDTNWQTGTVYALKGTTVMFRVQGSVGGAVEPNIVWPPGLPSWSNGSNGVAATSITFNTLSPDTTGQPVIVTAGSKATNMVVVFDYEVKFRPSAGPGRFEGRAEYPTGFGVGEGVDFVAKFEPEGITTANAGGIEWTVTGMHDDSSHWGDLSLTNATSITLGAFEEVDQVRGTLTGGISGGAFRTNEFSVWRPTGAILKDLMVAALPATGPLFAWPQVGHSVNTISCRKRAAYFLQPSTNSYHAIKVHESTGTYSWSNGLNSYPAGTNLNTAIVTFSLTNAGGITTSGPISITLAGIANHKIGDWFVGPLHLPVVPGGAMEKNFWGIDTFGGKFPTRNDILPNPADHVPVIVTTRSVNIKVEFSYLTEERHDVGTVNSRRDIWSTGRMVIKKGIPGGSSGEHPKEFADGESNE